MYLVILTDRFWKKDIFPRVKSPSAEDETTYQTFVLKMAQDKARNWP